MKTRISKINSEQELLGRFAAAAPQIQNGASSLNGMTNGTHHTSHFGKDLERWEVPSDDDAASESEENVKADLAALQEAAQLLRERDIPVAFPTETVYGLGADATRSGAVKGIYAAKGRPSDNPLIVHVCDLTMLRNLLLSTSSSTSSDPIPAVYKPLIDRFWPGPLTILLPNPNSSTQLPPPVLRLAPEVTAGLSTFGCRMPASPLARSLISLTGRPLAAPSANASTRPSPTTAQHVYDDLDGRIELILDGGACQVGVESTVVDGLCTPPVILRPGGISIEELRQCAGWESVEKAYKDQQQHNGSKEVPRAPGMKYKHYSPKAKVILYEQQGGENRKNLVTVEDVTQALNEIGKEEDEKVVVAIVRTRYWPFLGGIKHTAEGQQQNNNSTELNGETAGEGESACEITEIRDAVLTGSEGRMEKAGRILDVNLGKDVGGIARGLFAVLREMDKRGADVIFVEGVAVAGDDKDGRDDGIAAAVMNRLRKAASEIKT
ncbi:translation factor [Diplogelasinospora grovesii]|uniref:Threonylcarbamoyl-AMP synthase n=1 Tax=Diplogelasinospora grovesii TaxID=303347 RepID=A0AAN6N6D9_9PEZI|nr:translation factor [Diplogelasinospora grovesii]